VVEVLGPEEFEEDHLPGAINLPLRKLETEAGRVLDRSRPVLVYWGLRLRPQPTSRVAARDPRVHRGVRLRRREGRPPARLGDGRVPQGGSQGPRHARPFSQRHGRHDRGSFTRPALAPRPRSHSRSFPMTCRRSIPAISPWRRCPSSSVAPARRAGPKLPATGLSDCLPHSSATDCGRVRSNSSG
jgi:hypothetical protein